ncbi:MAG: hypothetical protein R3Y24_10710 [Eubacteriales bacterium]
MYTQDDRKSFSEVAESLKKYRRADLTDDNGKSLLDELYTDLLPNNLILEKCLRDHTTFLIGRKGTGKSTVFLKLENEYRKKNKYLPCYIDVKTVFEASKAQAYNTNYLKDYISQEVFQSYLIQRNFIKNVLKSIYDEIEKKERGFFRSVQGAITGNAKEKVREKILGLIEKIDNNEHLKSIELPIFQDIHQNTHASYENKQTSGFNFKSPEVNIGSEGINVGTMASLNEELVSITSGNKENFFNSVFLQVFEIKSVIEEISDILSKMQVTRLVLLLDDVSEIEYSAMQTFIDTIVAPLNNWSNEFVKFKVAFYPGRIYYGQIDPGKIDTVYLDFYKLYSTFEANKMNSNAIDFTERIIESRFKYYGKNFNDFIDTSQTHIYEYYELIFNTTMNVPRIIGYLFSYLYESNIIHNKKISKSDIAKASQRYFEEKIDAYFENSVYQLLTYEETKSIFELKTLGKVITDRLSDIKSDITTGKLKGSLYDNKEPYSSHFYVVSEMEKELNSLELNHYITKYDERTDRDKNKISIYSINYGLAQRNNLLWGRKSDAKYSKYFVERPFNFSKMIVQHLSEKELIKCTNKDCSKEFEKNNLDALKLYGMQCPHCNSEVIIEKITDPAFEQIISKVSNFEKLGTIEYSILLTLLTLDKVLYARQLSEEIDLSSYLIAARCKKLDEEKGYVVRQYGNGAYTYKISEAGKNFFEQ